jgi:hypothetical protein
VVVGQCDSGVPNDLLPTGCTTVDLILQCRLGSSGHRGFVACLWNLLTNLRQQGVVTGIEAGRILRCASRGRDDDSEMGRQAPYRDDDVRGRRDRDQGSD